MIRKRTEITVEIDRLVVIHENKRIVAWCAPCAELREMLASDDAALIAQVKSSTIFQWVESGRIHATETPEGLLLICSQSLTRTKP